MVNISLLIKLLAPFFLSAAFEPIGLWFCAPIGYAIYLTFLRRDRNTVAYSIYFALVANLIVLVWSGVFVGTLPWVLLAILQALYFIPIGILARYTDSLPLLISAILVMEEVKARFPFGGFSWTRIAFSQIDSPLAPIVSIGGVLSLSFATLLLSYLFITRKKGAALLFLILAVVPSLLLPGASGEQNPDIKFVAVQGGTPSTGLNFNARAMGVLNMHLAQSYKSLQRDADLIIWPENAIDIDPLENKIVAQKIKKLVTDSGVPLLAGAVLSKGPINAAILFKDDGEVGSMYFKRYLTPFGEYIPLRNIAEIISPYAKRVTDFQSGVSEKVHSVNGINIASIICFEIINDGIVREAANLSGLFVVHTNSATFAGTSEGDQQLAITRLRALEHARPIISISTTGPSAIVNERGVVIESLKDGEIGSLSGSLTPSDSKTLSDRLGGFAPLIVISLALLWSLEDISQRRRKLRR